MEKKLFKFILFIIITAICLISNIYCNKNDSSKPNTEPVTKSIIQKINRGTSDYVSDFKNPVEYNLNLLFIGNNGTKEKLYQYDRTSIRNILPGSSDYKDGFEYGIVFNSKLYFSGNNGDINKIYEYDGTFINNISTGSSDYISKFEDPIEYNSKLYFRGNNGTADKIYEFDGISVNNISTGTSDYQTGFSDACGVDFCYEDIIIYNSKLYFAGNNGVDNNLYAYDGISISNVSKGTSDYQCGFIRPFIFNEKLYFAGSDESNEGYSYEALMNLFDTLYEFDGESIKNIHSIVDCSLEFYCIYNSKLYFSYVWHAPGGEDSYSEIYEYDGSSTIKSVSVDPNTNYKVGFKNPLIYNSQLYFDGYTIHTPGWENWTLYKYDGVSIKFVNISDFWQYQIVFNSRLYFTFFDPGRGYNPLYVYDEISSSIVYADPLHDYICTSSFDPVPFNTCIYFEGAESEDGSPSDKSHIYECDGDDVKIVPVGTSDYKIGFNQPIIEYNSQLLFKGNNGENDIIYSLVTAKKGKE